MALTFLDAGLYVSMHAKYVFRNATVPFFVHVVRDNEK
jgi:hypothetical protein